MLEELDRTTQAECLAQGYSSQSEHQNLLDLNQMVKPQPTPTQIGEIPFLLAPNTIE